MRVPCGPDQERNPITGRCRKTRRQPNIRRTTSEGSATLPVGTTGVAPLTTREAILGWAYTNCKNDRDPITGTEWTTADAATLQDIIRLHNRTCLSATHLNDRVAAEHKAGRVAIIPGDGGHLTLDDFKALREAMRRRIPAYKIPARKHQPPPPNWQLYVSSDTRSGADFASVCIIDETKMRTLSDGYEIPLDSILLDLGFIPLTITDGICKPQTIVDIIRRLFETNRLLTPVAGGWKPLTGFPYSKRYWQTRDAKDRLGKLCLNLTQALTTPL